MNLTFYNHYGNGDLFESREFALDWMKLAGVPAARYAHRRLPGLFADLPQITSIDVLPEMDMRAAVTRRGEELWVNTWIGARNAMTTPRGDYVLWPGVGCTVEHIHRMHNDYLREAGLPPLPRSVVEYLPDIDYTRIDLGPKLHAWLDYWRGARLILLCNGATGSGHAANFDFRELLAHVPPRPGIQFILTERCELDRPDVSFSDDITERAKGGWDLNAISYLSRHCEVIAGRCSGAQMFTQVLPNWMDGTKTQVCFTHHRNGACFVLDPEKLGLRMKVRWSGAETPAAAADVLKEVIGGYV